MFEQASSEKVEQIYEKMHDIMMAHVNEEFSSIHNKIEGQEQTIEEFVRNAEACLNLPFSGNLEEYTPFELFEYVRALNEELTALNEKA